METARNFYELLAVPENASFDEIKKAYRKLSLKFHPDRNSSDTGIEMMRKINEAYETLSDAELKKKYDHEQKISRSSSSMHDFDTIFQTLFNTGDTRNVVHPAAAAAFFASAAAGTPAFFPHMNNVFMQKPVPINMHVTVTFQQVFSGGCIPLEVERWMVEKGTKQTEIETVYVSIPTGIDENEILVIKEKGNIMGEIKGDIKVFVKVSNTTEFTRNGIDLIFDKTISLKESLCGFSFPFTFLDGKTYTLNNVANPHSHNIIPPNYRKIIPNMGLKRAENCQQGNLIICFHVQFPDKLSDDQLNSLQSIL